jgi:hypothetical protein
VCEEKPALVNVTEAKRIAWSVIASEGSADIAGTAVTLLGCPCVQHSMGHFPESLAVQAEDSDAARAW